MKKIYQKSKNTIKKYKENNYLQLMIIKHKNYSPLIQVMP